MDNVSDKNWKLQNNYNKSILGNIQSIFKEIILKGQLKLV